MTTIFTVSVDAVEGSTLRGRVHLVNSDVRSVPRERTFPLSLLVDAWWHLDHEYLHDESTSGGSRNPFSGEQGRAVAAGMRLRDEYVRLFDLILGRRIPVTEDGYLLADDRRTVLEPRRKAADVYVLDGGSGHDGTSSFRMTPGDEEAFSRCAEEVVTAYDIGPYRNVPLLSEVAAVVKPDEPWDPERPDGPADLEDYDTWRPLRRRAFAEKPYADIAVAVGDPGYLEHMAAGMRWSTTMTGDVC